MEDCHNSLFDPIGSKLYAVYFYYCQSDTLYFIWLMYY